MSKERFFPHVSNLHMPGESRVGFEVLVRGMESVVPGFRNMIYGTLNDRFLMSKTAEEASYIAPALDDNGVIPPPLVQLDLVPVLKSPERSKTLMDTTRRRMLVSMNAGYPEGNRMVYLNVPLNMAVNSLDTGQTDLEIAGRVDIGRSLCLRGTTFKSRSPLQTFTTSSRRSELDDALRFQFAHPHFQAVIEEAAELFAEQHPNEKA